MNRCAPRSPMLVSFLLVSSLVAGCRGSDPASAPADRLVYQGQGGTEVIITMRSDGTAKSSPTNGVPGADQTNPDWSPDGTRIVFVLADGATDDLWTVGADGASPALLLACEAPCVYFDDPAWSPSGEDVMYSRVAVIDGARVATLESVDVDDGSVTVWLTAPATDVFAGVRYSPDGRSVVFEHVTTDGTAIDSEVTGVVLEVLDLDDPEAEATPITEPSIFAVTADWGPYGDRIVFSGTPEGGGSDLYTIEPDGSGLTRLTTLADDGGAAAEPAWSSDGSVVYFSALIGDRSDVLAKVPSNGGAASPAVGDDYDVAGRHPRAHAG